MVGKLMSFTVFSLSMSLMAMDWEIVNNYEWEYSINNEGTAEIFYCTPLATGVTTGSVIIPSSLGGKTVTGIVAYGAFGAVADSMTSVTIPNTVTRIMVGAFEHCVNLKSVHISDIAAWCRVSYYSYYSYWDREDYLGFDANYSSSLLDFAGGSVMDGATPLLFAHDLYLNGSLVTNLDIPYGVGSIGPLAFYGCTNLTSVTIPNSVTNIGPMAFNGCSGLTSVAIPDSVTSIGAGAFSDTPFYSKLPDGLVVLGKVVYRMKGTCPAVVAIPYGVKSIGAGAFSCCNELTSVTIPNSVTDIGSFAFFDCSGLTSVTIPDSVTHIGEYAFCWCTALTGIKIPDGVTSIADGMFFECYSLLNVIIGASVRDVNEYAFYDAFADDDGIGCYITLPEQLKGWIELKRKDDWMFGARITYYDAFSGTGGTSPSVGTTIVQQVEAPYALTNTAMDRAIASVTVDGDCAIDSFVLKTGKVYDTMLRVVNTANHEVRLTLPPGYEYETFKGVKPLTIPANSRNILSITRTADRTFLVSREELETVQ